MFQRRMLTTATSIVSGILGYQFSTIITPRPSVLYHQTPEYRELKAQEPDRLYRGDAVNARELATSYNKMFYYEEALSLNGKNGNYTTKIRLDQDARVVGIRALSDSRVHLQVLDDRGRVVYNTDAPYVPRHALPFCDEVQVRVRCAEEPTLLVTYGTLPHHDPRWPYDPTSISLMF